MYTCESQILVKRAEASNREKYYTRYYLSVVVTHTYIHTNKHAIKSLPVNQIVNLQAEDEMVVNEVDAMASKTCNPFCCVNYSCQQQAAKAVEKLMEER